MVILSFHARVMFAFELFQPISVKIVCLFK